MQEYSERIATVAQGVVAPDERAGAAARSRLDSLTKPKGSLGRLEQLVVRLAAMQGRAQPRVRDKAVIVMAADHGVAEEHVSAYPKEVTAQMVRSFIAEQAAINVLGRYVGARVVVVDMGVAARFRGVSGLVDKKVAQGTANFAYRRAMSRRQAAEAIMAGIQVLQEQADLGLDVIAAGEMGIGNSTAAAAVGAALLQCPPGEIVGKGTGVGPEQIRSKAEIIRAALRRDAPDPQDPLDVLSSVGGFEIAGLMGMMVAAAARRIPVVLDGFIATAAAVAAVRMCPGVKDYLIAGHLSAEQGHRLLLQALGLEPLLALEMRLGEGTGAALALGLCEAAANILAQMATFEQAAVSQRQERGR